MLYTGYKNEGDYFIKPVIKKIGGVLEFTTWKNNGDQKNFNFEYQLPLALANDYFHWKAGAPWDKKNLDFIESIDQVLLKDGYLIIAGRKTKGNE